MLTIQKQKRSVAERTILIVINTLTNSMYVRLRVLMEFARHHLLNGLCDTKTYGGKQMETKRLDELCLSITDCPHSTPKWQKSGKLVLRNFNIHGGRVILTDASYTDEHTFEERNRRATPVAGDIVISREAPMGEVAVIPEKLECCLGQRMVLLHPDNNACDNRYLMYMLLSPYVQKQISKSDKTGSIVSNLCIPDLCALKIPYIEREKQKGLVELLTAIDSKIDNNNAICADLEAMTKLLYDYWFVQFDFPDENGKPYKSSGGKMVWNEKLKREIPEGWESSTISTFCRLSSQKSAKPFITERYVSTENMLPNMQGIELNATIPASADMAIDFEQGDILISNIRPYFKKIWYASFDGKASTDVLVLKPKNDEASVFLYQILARQAFFDYVMQGKKGSKMPRGDKDRIMAYPVALPPKELQQRVFPILKSTLIKQAQAMEENHELKSLRDFLLPMLMNGQVKVG